VGICARTSESGGSGKETALTSMLKARVTEGGEMLPRRSTARTRQYQVLVLSKSSAGVYMLISMFGTVTVCAGVNCGSVEYSRIYDSAFGTGIQTKEGGLVVTTAPLAGE